MEHKTALSFYGKKTDYRLLFERIDQAERALRAWGIQRGDIVAVSLPGIPEAVYLLYAINKIGGIYCAFDCRAKEPELSETLEKFKPKLCIIPSFQLKSFQHLPHQPVLVVEITHSMGRTAKAGAFLADVFTGRARLKIRHKNFIPYRTFLRKEKEGKNLPAEKGPENVFGYFYTGGTTYGRKSIVLTNENINGAVYQNHTMGNWTEQGDSLLDIMPLFTCYGVTVGMHFPLSFGIQVKLIPLINPKKLKQTLLREKPNFLLSVPAHWEYFAKDRFRNRDLSFLKTVLVGGDKMAPEYCDKINRIFRDCGSTARIRCGYGLSEATSSGTLPTEESPRGSVGRPGKFTLVGIFDKDTLKPVPTGQTGEICLYGPTLCKGYYQDEAMTKMLLKEHGDGSVWLHSGDVGYLDEKGNLFFCERLKRMYVRYDGTKVSPYAIEQVLEGCPQIARCMIVAIPDRDHTCGMCARALIVLKKKDIAHRTAVEKYIREHLGVHMLPKETVYVETLPYTKNGKLDYFSPGNGTGENLSQTR